MIENETSEMKAQDRRNAKHTIRIDPKGGILLEGWIAIIAFTVIVLFGAYTFG